MHYLHFNIWCGGGYVFLKIMNKGIFKKKCFSELDLDLINKLKDVGKWIYLPQLFINFPNIGNGIVLIAILFFSMTCSCHPPSYTYRDVRSFAFLKLPEKLVLPFFLPKQASFWSNCRLTPNG